jgi:hypothetical protein
VPVRARRDGWTPDRQRRFIASLALEGCASRAARAVGLSRESAYRLRTRRGAQSFAAAWDAALAATAAVPRHSGATSWQRAFEGVLVPVIYRGRKVGERRKFDDRAAYAILASVYAAREARREERRRTRNATGGRK